jgi:hypothetical protein
VNLGSIQGQFTLGTADSYAPIVQGQVADALRQRGYVVRSASTFWGTLWDQQAPFHMTVKVYERYTSVYPQTKNRMTMIDFRPGLQQKGKPKPIWEGLVSMRSRYPNPDFRTVVTGKRSSDFGIRNPEAELMMYRDARAPLAKQLANQLEILPENRTPLTPAPALTGSP